MILEFYLGDTHNEITDFNYFESERVTINTKMNINNGTSSFTLGVFSALLEICNGTEKLHYRCLTGFEMRF